MTVRSPRADLSALQAGAISPACAATNCADVNAVGGVELGDQVVLSRFLGSGGTIGEPGRSQGEQNLLFKLCTGAPPPLPCNTPATAVNGRFTTNQTWPGPADGCNEFYIRGRVTIANGTTLTIRPGAVIRARADSQVPTLILITRGSKLNANGATNPIILTSDRPPGSRGSGNPEGGDWAGVVINGFAPENVSGGAYAEGLFGNSDAEFGGDNPNALSALVRFVRIEFTGRCHEIDCGSGRSNALSLNSVGRLTTLDHVQVNQGLDDGFEWFGGTVRGKFLVATGIGDDGFTWRFGYQGQPNPATTPLAALQFGLVHHDAESISSVDAHGIEGDNHGGAIVESNPRSAPHLCNITAVGPRGTGSTAGPVSDGARIWHGTAGRLENAIIENWLSSGVDIRDASPFDFAPRVRLFNNGSPPCNPPGNPQCADLESAGSSALAGPLTYPGDIPGYCTSLGNFLDNRYLLAAATPAPDDCEAADPFFDSAPYPGAFNTSGNWLTQDKPCCPSGNPFAIIAGQRCWISFDTN